MKTVLYAVTVLAKYRAPFVPPDGSNAKLLISTHIITYEGSGTALELQRALIPDVMCQAYEDMPADMFFGHEVIGFLDISQTARDFVAKEHTS